MAPPANETNPGNTTSMAPVRNGRVLFANHPDGMCIIRGIYVKITDDNQLEYPIPGKDIIYDESETIDLEHVPLNGGFLLKTLALSLDPYMRGRMRKVADVGVGSLI